MKKIITISRECGSGGRQIGKKLAEKLGYSYYDKELIDRVAKESGLAKDFIEEQGEHITGSLLFNIASNMTYAGMVFGGNMLPLQDQLFVVQSDIIKDIANKENCVIVGRCADFILKDYPDALHVFIHADEAFKAERIVRLYGESEKKPEERLREKDTKRAVNYKHFTDRNWGDCRNYDLSLNSGKLGIDRCAELIVTLANIE